MLILQPLGKDWKCTHTPHEGGGAHVKPLHTLCVAMGHEIIHPSIHQPYIGLRMRVEQGLLEPIQSED